VDSILNPTLTWDTSPQANWDPKKNASTIKATPKDSKAYFASAYENGVAPGAK
jgi:hypothetical protein